MFSSPYPLELLTTDQMAHADRLTIANGVPGMTLMENAAAAIARTANRILQRTSGRRILVLCGPGNNGGDGFVAARLLQAMRYRVRVACMVAPDKLRGDAARAAAGWRGETLSLDEATFETADLVIDAIFGAGLARELNAQTIALVERLNDWRRRSNQKVVSVDIPTGVDGTTGRILGAAVEADATVTFFRLKTGHLLLPGRLNCGRLVCAHIGIRSQAIEALGVAAFTNSPDLWGAALPVPRVDGHKYARGHAVVLSGGASATGAARLAACAALRAGAGLVTLGSPGDALAINAAALTAVMVRAADGPSGVTALLSDPRKNVVALGPALGVGAETRRLVEAALAPQTTGRAAVLDADALTSFEDARAQLWQMIRAAAGPTVLTPHAAEFERLFGDTGSGADAGSKLDRAREAARISGAVLLFKGPDTVVAAPDGRATILPAASPWLATAGSGDVLTGIVAGLLAQRMEAFLAAACAVWMHARAADLFGPGLIADDIIATLPRVWTDLCAGPVASGAHDQQPPAAGQKNRPEPDPIGFPLFPIGRQA